MDVDELQQVICCQSRQEGKGQKELHSAARAAAMVWLCGCEGVQVCLGCAVKTAEQSSWQARDLRLASGHMRCWTSHIPARTQGDISAQVGLHPPVPLDCVQRLLPHVCCLHSTAYDSFLLIDLQPMRYCMGQYLASAGIQHRPPDSSGVNTPVSHWTLRKAAERTGTGLVPHMPARIPAVAAAAAAWPCHPASRPRRALPGRP